MTEFAQNILALLGKSEAEIRPLLPEKHGGFSPRPASLHLLGRSAVLAGSEDGVPLLLVVADSRRRLPDGFEGEQTALRAFRGQCCRAPASFSLVCSLCSPRVRSFGRSPA